MIILSMIGINDYKETSYTWGGREAKPCRLVQQALIEWFPGASLLVCVTQKAKDKYGQEIKSIPNACLVDIPDGVNEAEFWKIYNKIEQEILQIQKDKSHCEELVLDITHGFRSLPILALLAVSFLRAAKQVQVKHVLYGAYDASRNGSTPVFDLAPFLSMLDWANATSRFLETGYPHKMAQLAELNNGLHGVVGYLTKFSYAMQLHDPVSAGQEAQNAVDILQSSIDGPMNLLRLQIKSSLEPLAFIKEKDDDEKQLLSIFNQIRWYQRHEHYEKAVGLAKEWLYLFARWKSGKAIWGNDSFKLSAFLGQPENARLKGVYDELKKLRDHMMHWRGIPAEDANGFSDEKSSKDILPGIHKKLRDLEEVVKGMGLNLPEVSQ